jgi:hypothetical protein
MIQDDSSTSSNEVVSVMDDTKTDSLYSDFNIDSLEEFNSDSDNSDEDKKTQLQYLLMNSINPVKKKRHKYNHQMKKVML